MISKVTLISLTILAFGSASALAGGTKSVVSPAKNPVYSKNPVSAPLCYDAGFEFGIFAAGFLPQGGGSGEHWDEYGNEGYKEAIGGGISLGYFFNENLGLDFGAAVYGTSSEVQNYTLDVVQRLPNQDACYAPYAFVGGGLHANGSNEGILRAGVGIDYKISDASSLFTDGAYNWVGGDVEEYITVRAGLRFNF